MIGEDGSGFQHRSDTGLPRLRAGRQSGIDAIDDERSRRRPHLLLLDRALAGRRGRDRRSQRRRRHRLVDLASGVLAHRAGAARQPLRRHHPRGLLPVRHPAHALFGRGGDRRAGARRLHRAPIPGRQCRSGRDRHRRADPHRRGGAPAQCPQDRRAVRAPGRQDGRGLGRRQPGDGDGRARLGRGGALDPRQGHDHERGRRRRHREDRGLRRRPGDRRHRARRRRAADLPRSRRPHRARRGGRPPLRRRARHQPRGRQGACARSGARARRRHGGAAVRGDARASAGRGRRRPAAARAAVRRLADRPGHIFGRRRRIHLRPRSHDVRRSRRAAGAGDQDAGRGLGPASSNARTRASAPP